MKSYKKWKPKWKYIILISIEMKHVSWKWQRFAFIHVFLFFATIIHSQAQTSIETLTDSRSILKLEISEGSCGICIADLNTWLSKAEFKDCYLICIFHARTIESAVILKGKYSSFFQNFDEVICDDECLKLSEIKITQIRKNRKRYIHVSPENLRKVEQRLLRLASRS